MEQARRKARLPVRGTAALLAAVGLGAAVADAAPLKISTWGGNWQELVENTAGQCFRAKTGENVVYVTGGTIDRLNRAQLAKGKPETDVTITTSHVGWLYQTSGLFEPLDMSRIAARGTLMPGAEVSPGHLGVFTYVYTLGYRSDLIPKGMTFSSWKDLWDPRLKNMVGMPDFDPSHIVAVASILEGGSPEQWEKGQDRLKALKPNVKAYFNSDAVGQNLIASGETPVQVMLSANGYHQMSQGLPVVLIVPKEGAVVGLDTVSIDLGSTNKDKAYTFINCLLEPEVQAKLAKDYSLGPMNAATKVDAKTAALPGMYTTPEQLKGAIVVDAKLRAEKLNDWKKWFAENMVQN
jgi:putative spermidine/putrescine transport system substrate-binding protein